MVNVREVLEATSQQFVVSYLSGQEEAPAGEDAAYKILYLAAEIIKETGAKADKRRDITDLAKQIVAVAQNLD